MAHEKTYLVAIFECLMGNGQKTENYICNAKTLPRWLLILSTTVQRAVKIQFQLRCLRKYLRSLTLTLPLPLHSASVSLQGNKREI